MKKTIALFIICLMATMSLTACGGTNTTELSELRNQVNSLEARVSELEKSESIVTVEESIPEKDITASTDILTEATESNTTTVETNMQMSEYLDNQVKSNNPVNWLEVANCDVATEKSLLEVAKKCANYYTMSYNESAAVELANAISKNPNSTDNVMKTLTESVYHDVWLVVANSEKSKEGALQSVAKKCANCYTMSYNKSAAVELANAISKNPNSTNAVMEELVNSAFPEVTSIGHQWIETN